MVNKRHLQNRITSVTSGDTTISDLSEIQKVFVDHFQDLLAATPNLGCPAKEEIQAVLNHSLDEDQDFFVTGKLLKQINTTIIALVPKIPNASTVHDFKPIACCNTIYKCITKLIANRLACVLPSIISLPQNAFVKGRHISDNILLAQELFSGFQHDPY
ncbi:uncharacterized protein LOC120295928 [Eucalyptus grandis]|uniref:uncharacterized protein LOC120295928 n=1 Tax=Eucalyptus grandis TaxID=71139 RepID=UPI00192E98AA|nr:uncharacterized protein LOC120295928 [Eucalyptus grandis]